MKREEILGEIQALRAELERVETREQARGVARRIRALGKEAHTARTLGDLVGIASFLGVVDRFVEEARVTIVDIYGTSGWDEPETLDQAMARRVPLAGAPELRMRHTHGDRRPLTEAEALHGCPECAAPTGIIYAGEDVLRPLTDAQLDAIEARAVVGIPPTTRDLLAYASEMRAQVPRLLAEVRRLRADEWLQRATAEIATASFGVDRPVVKAAALTILRKHRDGKA